MGLFNFFTQEIAIDLGTANTLVYVKGKGIILNEPSVVAIATDNKNNKSVLAVGTEAKLMLGRTPGSIQAIRPMKDGVISDFMVCEKMLQHFIRKVHDSKLFRPSPRVLVCVPCLSTEVEKRAVRDSAEHAGAKEVYMVHEPIAAAIGLGIDIERPIGSMIVDIGGGTSDFCLFRSLKSGIEVLASNGVRIGGTDFDRSLSVDHVSPLLGRGLPIKSGSSWSPLSK